MCESLSGPSQWITVFSLMEKRHISTQPGLTYHLTLWQSEILKISVLKVMDSGAPSAQSKWQIQLSSNSCLTNRPRSTSMDLPQSSKTSSRTNLNATTLSGLQAPFYWRMLASCTSNKTNSSKTSSLMKNIPSLIGDTVMQEQYSSSAERVVIQTSSVKQR